MTPIDPNELKLLCEQMAKKLDDIKPGWYEKVDTDKLHMEKPCSCIGHYVFGVSANFELIGEIGHYDLDRKAFGYSGIEREWGQPAPALERYYESLTEIWTNLINERKQ